MLVNELAEWIRKNKPGVNYPGVHPSGDESVVIQYTRHEMCGDVHITDVHIFECCAKAASFEEHIVLCRPLPRLIPKPGSANGTNRLLKDGRAGDLDKQWILYLSNLLLAHPCFYNTGSVE